MDLAYWWSCIGKGLHPRDLPFVIMGVVIISKIVPLMSSNKIQQFRKVAMCLPNAVLYTTHAACECRITKQPVLSKSGKKRKMINFTFCKMFGSLKQGIQEKTFPNGFEKVSFG